MPNGEVFVRPGAGIGSRRETPVEAPVTGPASLLAAGDCKPLN